MAELKRVKLMRGNEASRLSVIPAQGEQISTTDELKLYLGDGNKAGGYIVNADNTIAVWPDQTDATKRHSLAWWIAYFNGNEATIRIPRGTHEILKDLTIPENICLRFDKGAVLAVVETKTLTIDGVIVAHGTGIFGGTGAIAKIGVNNQIDPDWFSGSDKEKIQQALDLLERDKCYAIVFKRMYDITGAGELYLPRDDKRYYLIGQGGGIKKTDSGYVFTDQTAASGYHSVTSSHMTYISEEDAGTHVWDVSTLIGVVSINDAYYNVDYVMSMKKAYEVGWSQVRVCQSCKLINCDIQGGIGDVVNVNVAFDFEMNGCRIEKRTGSAFRNYKDYSGTSEGHGCRNVRILNNCIEAMYGEQAAIETFTADLLIIENNYFEACYGGYIDLSKSPYALAFGVVMIKNNNFFGGTETGSLINPDYAIKWGKISKTSRVLSIGNVSSVQIHLITFAGWSTGYVTSICEYINGDSSLADLMDRVDLHNAKTQTYTPTYNASIGATVSDVNASYQQEGRTIKVHITANVSNVAANEIISFQYPYLASGGLSNIKELISTGYWYTSGAGHKIALTRVWDGATEGLRIYNDSNPIASGMFIMNLEYTFKN